MFALPDKRASFLASQPKATNVKMENYDQRVIIFFALCPLSYDIILGVAWKCIDGLRRRLGGETSGEERELLKTSSCHTARAFGRKGRSGKLQKELTEMNRETTILCVMAGLAMATLALPTENTYHAVTNAWYNSKQCPMFP